MKFLAGDLRDGTPQDHSKATYSIWRDADDYWIDWTQDSETIERTIRALGKPYLGARSRLNDKTIIISESVVEPDICFAIRQPGKVWSLDETGCPTIVCGRGMLRITSAMEEGRSIIPMRSLRLRFY